MKKRKSKKGIDIYLEPKETVTVTFTDVDDGTWIDVTKSGMKVKLKQRKVHLKTLKKE